MKRDFLNKFIKNENKSSVIMFIQVLSKFAQYSGMGGMETTKAVM